MRIAKLPLLLAFAHCLPVLVKLFDRYFPLGCNFAVCSTNWKLVYILKGLLYSERGAGGLFILKQNVKFACTANGILVTGHYRVSAGCALALPYFFLSAFIATFPLLHFRSAFSVAFICLLWFFTFLAVFHEHVCVSVCLPVCVCVCVFALFSSFFASQLAFFCGSAGHLHFIRNQNGAAGCGQTNITHTPCLPGKAGS